jgi:hypothetical protein
VRKSKHKIIPENGVLEAFFHELTKVRDSQRSLVIITHGFVELLLNSVIDAKCKFGRTKITSNSRDYSHSVKLVLLNELGIMDDRLYDILDWFRKLRNRAAHEAFFVVSQSDLDFVNKSMNRFLSVQIEPSTGDLYRFCTLLIGTIWNGYLDELLSAFEPAKKERN